MKRIVIIIFLIIGALMIGSLFFVKVNKINIKGNYRYTNEEIENLVFKNSLSKNSAVILINKLLRKKESIPFVQDYSISFNSPFSIDLIIYEKSMVAYVEYMSSYMYFDKDGIVVESSGKRLEQIPMVVGLEFGQVVLYQKLPVKNHDIFNDILNLTQVLSIYDIEVDQIIFSEDRTAVLKIENLDIMLGDMGDINGKVSELNDILPKLSGLKGNLYMDSYDANDSSSMYTFKRKK